MTISPWALRSDVGIGDAEIVVFVVAHGKLGVEDDFRGQGGVLSLNLNYDCRPAGRAVPLR